jgi:hypothetical protein
MEIRTGLEICLMQWDHIAMHNGDKETAIRELDLPTNMPSNCAMCKLTSERNLSCDRCLIPWGAKYAIMQCLTDRSLFTQWVKLHHLNLHTKDLNLHTKAKQKAHGISDLALKKLNELFPEDLAAVKQYLKGI